MRLAFFSRPRPQPRPEDARRAERLLAVARLYLAAFAAAALALEGLRSPVDSWMIATYGAWAFAVLFASRRMRVASRGLAWTVHVFDLLWAAAFMAGSMAVGCVLFVFAMVGAAHRWDRRETLQSIVLGAVAIVSAALVAALVGRPFAGGDDPFTGGNWLWLALLALAPAAIIGLVVGEEKRLRIEAAVVSQALARSRHEHGVRDTLLAVFGDLAGYLGADHVVLAVADKESGRAYRWQLNAADGGPTLHYDELEGEDRADFLFDGPPGVCLVRRRIGRTGPEWIQYPTPPATGGVDLRPHLEGFARRHPFEDAMIAAEAIETWNGRLFVLGGRRLEWGEPELRFLERFFSDITPVIHNAYLLRRLRTRIGALERARIARDLHDGVVQSLFGLELRVDALRRRVQDADVAEELSALQVQIRRELAALRELMARVKPLALRSGQLVDYLADYVERFGRDTGIHSSFMSNVEEVHLPARICNDVAFVVQEALVNVRKHSGARNLLVRLTQTDARLTILVDDDGRGFSFSGHYSHRDLEEQRKGPSVIKERLRAIGGELTLDTGPGQGARLEIGIR